MVLQDFLKKDEQDFFAVFVVAAVPGGIAATTRAADRGESGRIRPFVASVEAVAQSGYGNDKAMRAWQALQASPDAAAANSSACSREAVMPAFAAAQTNPDAPLPAIGKKASKASSRRSMRMR